MNETVKLLYIAGDGRSGSTLLSRLLGEMDGCVDVGEMLVYFLNKRAFHQNKSCGCGHPIDECEFWKNIDGIIELESQNFATQILRNRSLPLLGFPLKTVALRTHLQNLSVDVEQLFRAVSSKANSNVIIDSSKAPSYFYLARQIKSCRLYVLHLVRDPRDVAASWLKPKSYLQRKSVTRAVRDWLFYNITTEWVSRVSNVNYLFMRYEDFVRDPQGSLEKIGHWINLENQSLNFLSGKSARLLTHHVLGGNPDKFDSGEITIESRPYSLALFHELLATVLTFPLLLKYHYPLIRPKKTE